MAQLQMKTMAGLVKQCTGLGCCFRDLASSSTCLNEFCAIRLLGIYMNIHFQNTAFPLIRESYSAVGQVEYIMPILG